MDVRYENVCKSFGGVDAVIDLDLHVPDGCFLALLGPSGCGKTTALRIMAGLEEPTSGRVFIGDADVTRLQPRDRDVAMVFQSYALYPHKNVRDNIAYPLRARRVPRSEHGARVSRVASLLSIEMLLDRRPRQLSGGQRQRVALARAIVREPRVFLMDEPLSNLDAQLRSQMRVEIKHLQRELQVTTLYVTHDQVEAMTMADLVAVMRDGELQQLAPPTELYDHPANLFVARFCGSPPMNVLHGAVEGGAFRHPAGDVRLAGPAADGPAVLGFRPEHVTIVEPGADAAVAGEIYVVEPLGNETLVAVKVHDELINVRAPADFAPTAGARCGLLPAARHLHLFDPDSGAARRDAAADALPPPTDVPSPTQGAWHD